MTAKSEQRKQWNQTYYQKTKAVHNPLRALRKEKWRKEQLEFLSQYKTETGCVDCGCTDHRAIEFDHLPGTTKSFCVSNGAGYSRARLLEEIAKCETVCGSCHNIRTYERRLAGVTQSEE